MKFSLIFLMLLITISTVFAQNGVYYNKRANMYMYIIGTKVEVTDDPGPYYWGNKHREGGFITWGGSTDSIRMTLVWVDGMVFTNVPSPIDSSMINPNYGRFAFTPGVRGLDLSGWFYDPQNNGWYFEFLRDTTGTSVQNCIIYFP